MTWDDDPQAMTDAAGQEGAIADRMQSHEAPYCSRCGREVACGADAVAVLCSWCTAYLAALRPYRSQRPVRQCPDCGGALGVRQRVCDSCREKRRKATYRRSRGTARAARNS